MDFIYEKNRIFAKDASGKLIAEVLFPQRSFGVVTVSHTYVDLKLRQQGVAGELLKALCAKLREDEKKAYPTCSYAVDWFNRHPEYHVFLADSYKTGE